MANKEMLIVFVYDLEFCKNEYDDPFKAIIYFHPSWVADSQKLSLCGQLMGMMNFCSDFEPVDFISLQNGKFKCERFGRFVVAIGTDRNVQESVLNHRNEFMKNIIKLYHNDINEVYEQFQSRKNFCDKIYQIFETYLPTLQYNSNVLRNVYKLHVPKSSSNTVYLNANQILENIITRPGSVLGGVILYNNKVICSQLSTMLTKILVATDPYRLKSTAEMNKNVNYHIPVGSQSIKIFITCHEYEILQKRIKKLNDATSLGTQSLFSLPFTVVKKKPLMKRDKSVLTFTDIPEEEPFKSPPIMEKAKRPNNLPLKLKSIPPESGIASIVSFDENDSYPEFIGRTTVAQTPLLPQTPMVGKINSIFLTKEIQIEEKPSETKVDVKSPKKEKKEWKKIIVNCSYANPFIEQIKKKSWDDINTLDDDDSEKSFRDYDVYKTISDPFYPMINSQNKRPISKCLLDSYQELFMPPKIVPVEMEPKMQQLNDKTKKYEKDPMIMKRSDVDKSSPNRMIRNQKKKMMKLPIKSISMDIDSGKTSVSNGASEHNIFDSPSSKRRTLGGLTPLMSKLTLLAMNESEQQTPVYHENPIETSKTLFKQLSKNIDDKNENTCPPVDSTNTEMKKLNLFVCGEKNMSLMVVFEDENAFNHQEMLEICVNRLGRLEKELNNLINVTVEIKGNDYSFITYDESWDAIQLSGTCDNSTLMMHDEFSEKTLTDIIVRTNESIVYGHNNASNEVFYQHSAKLQSNNFPAPSEFTVISSAKRKLERDQSLVLF